LELLITDRFRFYLNKSGNILGGYIGFSRPRKLEAVAQRFADAMIAFKQTAQYQELLVKYSLE
jgi:hypothetical protein